MTLKVINPPFITPFYISGNDDCDLVPPELKFLYFLCQIISSLTTYLTTYPVVNHRPGGCELFLLLKTKYPDGNHVTDSSKLSNTSD